MDKELNFIFIHRNKIEGCKKLNFFMCLKQDFILIQSIYEY